MKTLYENIFRYEKSNNTAIYFDKKTISYQEMCRNIRKMISFLKDKGIKENDVITIALPNIPTSIYLLYALNGIGVIQNILHPLTPVKKIIASMEETKSKCAIICANNFKDNEDILISSKKEFFFVNPTLDMPFLVRSAFLVKYKKIKEDCFFHNLNSYKSYPEENNIIPHNFQNASIYLHSGGTSGNSKTIVLSDESINNLVIKVRKIIDFDIEGKSVLAVLPLFHGFGLVMGIHAPLSYGASCTLMIKFNVKKVIHLINEGKINLIIGIPLLYQKLLNDSSFKKAKLNNLNLCFIGGDNVSQNLINQFNKTMKENNSSCLLLEGYGLTETVTVCVVNTKNNNKIGSVGQPLEGIRIKILNEKQEEVPLYQRGEIFINGSTLMKEYLHDEETTNKTIINYHDEKWLKTGDEGYLDKDGFLYFLGRKKRIFIINGYNIYPSEVEKIALENNSITDASLEFFSFPKAHTNLYLIKRKDSQKNENQIKEEIICSLQEKVIKYALPQEIIFMDDFPKTPLGKISHQEFKDI
ncbi:MAG: class I adenylate-forming enzyme family protein [Bacilli bacterium]